MNDKPEGGKYPHPDPPPEGEGDAGSGSETDSLPLKGEGKGGGATTGGASADHSAEIAEKAPRPEASVATARPSARVEAAGAAPEIAPVKRPSRGLGLREDPPVVVRALLGVACIAAIFGLWWWGSTGAEGNYLIPSPFEVLASLDGLVGERDLIRNLLISLRRVFLGFGLAVLIAVPLGIFAASFRVINSFLFPIITFFRNTPMATLVPLTVVFFQLTEKQKVVFIFLATFAFVLADTVASVMTIPQRYVETAQTVGASRRQIIFKVLTPLALPNITTSVRFLFGLGFGYIILAEMLDLSSGGLGSMIIMSQRRAEYDDMYMIVFVIVALAFVIDRLLHFFQRGIFPYRDDL